jgi:glyoxylase-like metal-dependent hydrolase (beta-lactamase superfamily II)
MISSLRSLLLASALALPSAAGQLKLQTYVGSPAGFNVVSTLVLGEKESVLIDAQFTRSDAHRLVAQLIESGRTLKTVYVTHAHPDHYWGLEVIRAAFPQARFVARPEVVREIRESLPGKLKQWKGMYGANVPDHPLVPEAIEGTQLQLEGEVLEIHGGVQGDSVDNSYVYIPSLKAVVAGDIVYSRAHVWLLDAPKAESRQAWMRTLEAIAALKPSVVIAGHKDPAAPDTLEGVAHTRAYLLAFDEVLATAPTGEQLKTQMSAKFPGLTTLGVALDLASGVYGKKP